MTMVDAMSRPVLAASIVIASLGAALADGALQGGAYEVEVRLELPHIEDRVARKTATVCIADGVSDGTSGLAVLSDNNPLADCPARNVRAGADWLSFEIVCSGGNAATASATYTLAAERFEGRIAMKMGGKNMTMTETQVGRRIGPCKPPGAPRS
jgi:hypothetical protein